MLTDYKLRLYGIILFAMLLLACNCARAQQIKWLGHDKKEVIKAYNSEAIKAGNCKVEDDGEMIIILNLTTKRSEGIFYDKSGRVFMECYRINCNDDELRVKWENYAKSKYQMSERGHYSDGNVDLVLTRFSNDYGECSDLIISISFKDAPPTIKSERL